MWHQGVRRVGSSGGAAGESVLCFSPVFQWLLVISGGPWLVAVSCPSVLLSSYGLLLRKSIKSLDLGPTLNLGPLFKYITQTIYPHKVTVLAQAALTKHCGLGGSWPTNMHSSRSRGWKSRTRVPAGLVLVWAPCAGLQIATWCILIWQREVRQQTEISF